MVEYRRTMLEKNKNERPQEASDRKNNKRRREGQEQDVSPERLYLPLGTLLFMKVDNHSLQTEEQHFMTKLLDIIQFSVFLQERGIMREKIKQIYVSQTANEDK